MNETQKWLCRLLEPSAAALPEHKTRLLQNFAAAGEHTELAQQILDIQKMLTEKWRLTNRVDEIIRLPIPVPNGTMGKPYEAVIDFIKLGLDDIIFSEFNGLEDTGLTYNNELEKISGTPTRSGDIQITLLFRIRGEDDKTAYHEKKMTVVINPDPKSLWKHIPSDPDGRFAKPDDVSVTEKLGEKNIVVASKRGRSHANVGSYRDDDFAFRHFDHTGWSVVAVADGAGSAQFSRHGSEVAVKSVVSWLEQYEGINDFDAILQDYKNDPSQDAQKKLSIFIYNTLSQGALYVHKRLAEMAAGYELPLKDFHSTLIFTLLKKYDFGYAVLTFGVGDCPIAIINTDQSEVMLMNWLDVGEFGGGTRFITMPEIFTSDKFATRFRFKLVDDFSYLILMTDGIYDPKFVVEANLEKLDNWKQFIADLKGDNPDGVGVDFTPDTPEVAAQLSAWMDFWSSGNHDDRTLAIVY